MSHIYTSAGKLFQEGHRAWPNKSDGTPYKRIPAKVKERLQAEGKWPELFKSVTTYLAWAKGPALMEWKGRRAIEIAKAAHEDYQTLSGASIDFAKFLDEAYAEESNKASESGTAFHDAIEKYLSDYVVPVSNREMLTACKDIDALLVELGVTKQDGLYEVGFTDTFEGCNYGGTADAVFPGKYILDWKTTTGKKRGLPYPDQSAQLAMYRAGLSSTESANEPVCNGDERCLNVWINQETGKIYAVKEYSEAELELGVELFKSCCDVDDLIERLKGMKAEYRK